jgi:peptidoglycan/xylan/chitin deacetylase (PgdA/CDA1 family)
MFNHAKLAVLSVAERTGASRLIGYSGWRRRRLLILCYHGISANDEHEWSSLYITREMFRRRMQILVQHRCNVLSLSEAIVRLREGTLPPRAIAITFDDGFHDFYSVAFPVLESFGFPVTLYLTTYYVDFNRPVFDPMLSYLLWKGRAAKTIDFPDVLLKPVTLNKEGRNRAAAEFQRFASAQQLTAIEKDDLLAQLAGRLGVDYQDLCRRRVLQLITPAEAKDLAARGACLEYHTHRHRIYRSRERWFADLNENRSRILSFTSAEPHHFCYTGGFHLPEHREFLEDYGVLSATTCQPGMCTAETHPMLLPRLVDATPISDLEFRSWLLGTSGLLPRRRAETTEMQLMEEEELALL